MDQQAFLNIVNEKRFEDLSEQQREILGESTISLLAASPDQFSSYNKLIQFLSSLENVDSSQLGELTEKARLPESKKANPTLTDETPSTQDIFSRLLPKPFNSEPELEKKISKLQESQEETNSLLKELLSKLQ